MFMNAIRIEPARVSGLLAAAERAARAIPPAFPLDATVAVNPFLGQSGEALATASARLARVAGAATTRPRSDYAAEIAAGRIAHEDLEAALAACASPLRPRHAAALKAAARQAAPRAPPRRPQPRPCSQEYGQAFQEAARGPGDLDHVAAGGGCRTSRS